MKIPCFELINENYSWPSQSTDLRDNHFLSLQAFYLKAYLMGGNPIATSIE